MVDHLPRTYDLSREDAYVLSSLVVDLKISEIVDAGRVRRQRAAAARGLPGMSTPANAEASPTLELVWRHDPAGAAIHAEPASAAEAVRAIVDGNRGFAGAVARYADGETVRHVMAIEPSAASSTRSITSGPCGSSSCSGTRGAVP